MTQPIRRLTGSLTFALMLGAALPAYAQDATVPAPVVPAPGAAEPAAPADPAAAPEVAPAAAGLSMGSDVAAAPEAADDAIGATYSVAAFGSWEQRCVRTETGADPCQLYQLLKDANASPVAEISIFALPEGQAAAAGATIIAPLETLLTEQLVLQVDTSKAKVYPFTWCSPTGCFARVGFTAEEVAAFKAGGAATITIVPVVAPDEKVVVTVPLTGFTAGYDAVAASNAKIDAAN